MESEMCDAVGMNSKKAFGPRPSAIYEVDDRINEACPKCIN
jgi:hypothetical protein